MPFFGCAICLTQYNPNKEESIYSIHCGHVFHEKCLRRWLKTQFVIKSCPTCRKLVHEFQMRRIYLNQLSMETIDDDDDDDAEADEDDDDEAIEEDIAEEDTIDDSVEVADDNAQNSTSLVNTEIEENFTQARMALQRMRTKLHRMSEHLSTMQADMDMDQERLDVIEQVLHGLIVQVRVVQAQQQGQ